MRIASVEDGLALIVGSYLVLSTIGMLRHDAGARFLENLARHPAAMHAVGAVAFLSGAAVELNLGSWGHPLTMLVSLVAALWIIEGAGMLLQPGLMATVMGDPQFARRMRLSQWLQLAIGLVLLGLVAIGYR